MDAECLSTVSMFTHEIQEHSRSQQNLMRKRLEYKPCQDRELLWGGECVSFSQAWQLGSEADEPEVK